MLDVDVDKGDPGKARDAELQTQLAEHIAACRKRIPAFVRTTYLWPGAIRLNRAAWSTDVFVAPFNFLMGFPNFVLRIAAAPVGFLRARKLAQRLHRSHLGLRTKVQTRLTAKLMTDLLDLPVDPEEPADPVHRIVAGAAREPLRIYVQTRNVAADITAGAVAAVTGVVFLNQFTPGSFSAGSAIAHLVAKEEAVSEFFLGETLGRLYYDLFPVSPAPAVVFITLLLVMVTISLLAAFSGFIHDPIQALTGIHRRRLSRLLDAIEESINQPSGKGYRPKDTYFGRVLDLVDWIKGLLSF